MAADGTALAGSVQEAAPIRRSLWSWLLAIPLAAVLLYYSLRGVDWHRVWLTIAGARWELLLVSSAISCWSFFVRAVRWRILLNAEAKLSLGMVFCANMSGYMGNMFLPARAGEMVRTLVVGGRSALTKTYVLTTALCERLADAVALVLWASLIVIGMPSKPAWLEAVSGTTALIAGGGALAMIVAPHASGLFRSILHKLPVPGTLRTRLLGLMEQILLGMRAFHNWSRLFGFVALTVVIWISDAISILIGAHAMGVNFSFRVSVLLLTAMGLGSALPSTPGYVGIYQFVAVTVLVPFGITRDAALAYMLVAQAAGYLTVLALGLPSLYILRPRRTGRS